MSGFDRSKLRATSSEQLQKQSERVKDFSFDFEGIPFLPIKTGTNKFRIFPSHDASLGSFIVPRVVHWLPQRVRDKDSKTEKWIIKRYPVYNARIHSKKVGEKGKDIIEEYIKLVENEWRQLIKDEGELNARLKILTDYQSGISPAVSWVMYAKKMELNGDTFGFLEITDGSKSQLNKLGIDEENGKPIKVDIFSDPDTGYPIMITKDPDAAPKDKYVLSLVTQGVTTGKYALTDEELEAFLQLDSLNKLYEDNYTYTDFQKALDGLRIFDSTTHEIVVNNKKSSITINMLSDPRLLEIIESLSELFPVEESKGEEKEEEKAPTKGKVEELPEEEDPIVEGDQFSAMDRNTLKIYIRDNQIDVKVIKTYSDEDIRNLIRTELKNQKEEEAVEELPEEEPPIEEAPVTQPGAQIAKSRVQELRDKAAGKA